VARLLQERVGVGDDVDGLLIFCLRICDVSVGTDRVLFTVKGYRAVGASLGIVESAIRIFAISRLFEK
jgi:uncharacterized protein YebE (UPF0316 family)